MRRDEINKLAIQSSAPDRTSNPCTAYPIVSSVTLIGKLIVDSSHSQLPAKL